ncbi:MAG TPA: hypothetical protein VED43_08285 [Mycobacterium sp.]|nr:hypothetical protein [Mycobacterium sp.]
MDLAGLSAESGARLRAAVRKNSAPDKRTRRPRRSMPAVGMDRPAGDAGASAAAEADTADRRQADYFVRLLTQSRRLVDHRIDEYQKAIAVSEANGDVEGAGNFRRIARIEEEDRQTLDGLIEKLRRRFPHRVPGQRAPISPRARFVAR